VRRPKIPKSRWTILSPVEIAAVMRAFDDLIADASKRRNAGGWRQRSDDDHDAVRVAAQGELLGLRWRDLELSHPDGPRLHVRETFVRGHTSAPKTDEGARTITIEARSPKNCGSTTGAPGSSGRRVGVLPSRQGSPVASGYYAALVKRALAKAG